MQTGRVNTFNRSKRSWGQVCLHSHHVVHSQAPALTAKALHEMPPVFAISLSTDRLVFQKEWKQIWLNSKGVAIPQLLRNKRFSNFWKIVETSKWDQPDKTLWACFVSNHRNTTDVQCCFFNIWTLTSRAKRHQGKMSKKCPIYNPALKAITEKVTDQKHCCCVSHVMTCKK